MTILATPTWPDGSTEETRTFDSVEAAHAEFENAKDVALILGMPQSELDKLTLVIEDDSV